MLTFRLTESADPEERLEEAALWKALHDEYGEEIAAVDGETEATFGRIKRGKGGPLLDYWNDPAFLKWCQRSFVTVTLDKVEKEVSKLHKRGLSAFIKSTRSKHWIARVPVGKTFREVADAMVYSFIDGGPDLMVQELCHVADEHRFFVIDRLCATFSQNKPELTPLDYPARQTSLNDAKLWELRRLVGFVARSMKEPHAVIDVAFINGHAGVVEFNPMRLGQVGLFACDVRALAAASRKLLVPAPCAPATMEGGE